MLLTYVNSRNPAWRGSLRIQQAQQHHSPQQHRECCQHPRGNTQLVCKLSHLVWAKSFEKRFWMAVVFVGRFSHWRTWQMYKHLRWYNASLKGILTSYWQSWWRFWLHLQLGLLLLNEGHEPENAVTRQGEGPQNQPPMKLAQKTMHCFEF